MRHITSSRELRRAIAGGQREYRLHLNYGAFTRQNIDLLPDGRFLVYNYIDDSFQKLSGRELYTMSNIGEAMRKRSFVCDE